MDGRLGAVVGGLAVAVAALAVGLADGDRAAPAGAQSSVSASMPRTITVTGHGVVSAKPDTATVTLGVNVTHQRAGEALGEANRRAQAVIDALRGSGIADDDVVTTNVSLWPQYDQGRADRVSGYVASNDVRVTIRDLARAGAVIDAAARAAGDAARINGIWFSIDDTSEAIAAARADAVRDASVRAGQYATAGGVRVGGVVQISEQQVTNPWPITYASARDDASGVSVPLQPGTQDVTVDVTVVYELVS